MSSVTQNRYRDANQSALRRVFASWVATLPADGWEGTIVELENALLAVPCGPVPPYIPSRNGLGKVISSEDSYFASLGIHVVNVRTRSERRLRFLRHPK